MQVIDNFELSAKKSLDSRQNWKSLESLKSNTDILMPQGFLAYCRNEDKWYKMNCTDESNPTTYTWSEFNNKDNLSLETLNDVNIDDTISGDFVALVKKDTGWTNENLEIQEYTQEELLEKIGLTTEDADVITGLLTDSSVVSTTKTWNSSAIYTELKNTKEECNDYTLKQFAKSKKISYKIVSTKDEMTDTTLIYLMLDSATNKYDMYVKDSVDSEPTKIGNTDIDLTDYVLLTELKTKYYTKEDCDGKFATIAELDTKELFSTDEVKTNKVWVDGKPIYRKIYISSDFNFNDDTKLGTSKTAINNIDDLVSISGGVKNEQYFIPLNVGIWSGDDTSTWKFSGIITSAGTINIDLGEQVYSSKDNLKVVVEYTKTTDA